MERLSTGVASLDKLIGGGIPRGFMVAAVGEPGTGKTILCLHFINEGIRVGDKNIYVTTEETRDSIISQASQFGMDFKSAINEGKLIIIDALMGNDEWTLKYLDVDELINKVVEAKKRLGYGRARLVIDSLSAFWLSKPAMARQYSYTLKKVLSKWDFTVLVTSQYAITTSVPPDIPVFVNLDGEIRSMEIGELVDSVLDNSLSGDINVLSMDWNSYRLVWSRVGKFIRHIYSGYIYELVFADGSNIRVTAGHSVYVYRKGKIIAVPTDEIDIGDYVLTISNSIRHEFLYPVLSSSNSLKSDGGVELLGSKGRLFDRIRSSNKIGLDMSMGDIELVRVVAINRERVKDTYVYDLSVNGTENFIAGFGGVVCHNSEAFGFGVEHVADGILRFRKSIKGNILKRYIVIEKMRQTNHSLYVHEIQIVPGRGFIITSPALMRREDFALPEKVMRKLGDKEAEEE